MMPRLTIVKKNSRKFKLAAAGIVLIMALLVVWAIVAQVRNSRSNSGVPTEDEKFESPLIEYLANEAVAAPALSHDGQSIWYFQKSDGQLMRMPLSGERKSEPYLIPDRGTPQFVLWPDQGPDIILGTDQGIFYYNATTATMMRYPDPVKTAAWMPGGQRVAYVWSDDKGAVLSVAKSDLTDFKDVTKLPHDDFWLEPAPNTTSSAGSFVLFNPSAPDAVYLAINNIPGLQDLVRTTAVKDGKFSPDARKFAFVEEKNSVRSLYIVDIASLKVDKVGDLAEGGGFAWSRSGATILWSDKSNTIMARPESGKNDNILQNVPGAGTLIASEIVPGRSSQELFFVEKESGRLGRIIFK